MAVKYCKNCNQMVKPTKKEWSWVVFFLLLGIFYPVYRIFLPRNRCPICGDKSLVKKERNI